jgi:hypothetical protein
MRLEGGKEREGPREERTGKGKGEREKERKNGGGEGEERRA